MPLTLARFGFDTPRLAYAGRTAIAAALAFVLGWALGLEHPQWAGMSVWAASQPLREQLLEKSFFRVAGTLSGSIAGVLLVLASTLHPAFLVIGLALWVGLTTLIGNLQRGFVSYGTVLAGYTAAMVALLDTAHPDRVLALGADRLATALTGVAVATLAGYAFAPRADGRGLRRRMRALLADLLAHAARPGGAEAARGLLSRLAEIDDDLDPHAAGSLRSRREVRATRAVLIAAVPLLLHRPGPGATVPAQAEALDAAAQALRIDDDRAALAALTQAEAGAHGEASEVLARLDEALAAWLDVPAEARTTHQNPLPAMPVILHRDWAGAREAALRAGGSILLLGVIWLVTGWEQGGYMLLGLSVMLSLFSSRDNPGAMMRYVFLGQLLGALGALALRWLVWPMAGSEFQLILLTIPFILIGPFLVGHRRTVLVSFDYNMVLLLLLHPHYPLTGTLGASLMSMLAVVLAPLIAMLAYRLVYPTSLQRRLDALSAAMLHDLADLAGDATALEHRPVWRARLYYRTLRLVRLSERAARAHAEALDTAVSLLSLGQAVMRCHELAADPATQAPVRRAVGNVLGRARRLGEAPERMPGALAQLAARLQGDERRLMEEAASDLGALPRGA